MKTFEGQKWKFVSYEQAELFFLEWLKKWDWSSDMEVQARKWVAKRSLPQNALYWQWMTQLAKHFSGLKMDDGDGGKIRVKFTKDDMHDLMRHRFLGYTDEKTVGSTVIPMQLISTTGLKTQPMHEYMSKIDAFAADNGCLLPHPADSEYMEYKEASQ